MTMTRKLLLTLASMTIIGLPIVIGYAIHLRCVENAEIGACVHHDKLDMTSETSTAYWMAAAL